ncbi:class I SAM-dependent methyltransferase [Aquirufa sp. Wall-65K1]
MNSLNCKSCGSSNTLSRNYVDKFFDKTHLFNAHIVICCRDCGFGYSFPHLDEKVVYEFYKNVYRGVESPYYINFDQLIPQGKDRASAQLQLGFKYLTGKNKGNLKFLDIGPGDGSSFIAAKEKEIKNSYAIELSKDCSNAYERLFKVSTVESIERIPKNLFFDIILSSHCFEHFYYEDLILYLEKLKLLINKDGVLVVEVPNDDFRIMKNYSDSPHFCFFSMESLKKLFTYCGYEILFCDSCGHKIHEYDEITNKSYTLFSNLKTKSKNLISKSAFGRTVIEFLKSKLIYFKILPDPISYLIDFNNKTYEYGGDRNCLRIVGKVKNNQI